jgi:hypothetical protein
MYIRFVIHRNDQDSGRRQGLFQALSDLEARGALAAHEQALYDEIYEWFRHHLKKPSSFSRSSRPHARNVALSWFRDSATEHIAKMRALARILEARRIEVEMLRTDRPGYIVYEDEFQVAAEPFRETIT